MKEEKRLLAALSFGDFKAFGLLYEKYHQQLYGFALHLSKNKHEAEELVQSAFVSVWESRHSIDPEKPFGAYLFSIARNRFLDMLRKRIAESRYINYMLQQQKELVENQMEQQMDNSELHTVIEQLLRKIPERRRLIFRMSREEGLTYKQIARQLHISENTVDTQIRNVLKFLRKELPKFFAFF
ncbi:MAG: RNA polymerase sigma-70 factor [Bacteroidales bacterium]|jgi:RNA polymerase sigma-70 factor (ECF subfamily)|nr:RNA polymerase sigma-70 factor [Bacteroidales bacterium]